MTDVLGRHDVRKVLVTNEYLSVTSGYEGDIITYHATVKDDEGEPLPSAFIADLEMVSGTSPKIEIVLVDDQAFTPDVYTPFELTLDFTVPPNMGLFTIRLAWEKQTIGLTLFIAGRSLGLDA